MAMAWISGVKNSGKLTVYNGLVGQWANIFALAKTAFNDLMKKHGVGIELSEEKDEAAANVLLRQTEGAICFTYGKQSFTAKFDGTMLHGHTSLLSDGSAVEKAYSYLPSQPKIGEGENATQAMMQVIAVHELIHACGLDNNDHGDNGVFYSPLSPLNGKLIVPEKGKNKKPMPPMFLAATTVAKLQTIW